MKMSQRKYYIKTKTVIYVSLKWFDGLKKTIYLKRLEVIDFLNGF